MLCCFVLLCGCAPKRDVWSGQGRGFVLIDPGHGGFDGGTVADDGTVEKHVNLAVSLLLQDVLTVCGVPVRMTRDTDVGLVDGSESTIRQKKVTDMKSRLELYEQADAVISVHQNHFSVPKYFGTQLFYSVNHADSCVLAECIRQAVVRELQPANHRELKSATDGIYLLHHTTKPAVLVECGFLSNPEERQRLLTDTYRQQLAFAIVMGYFQFILQK